MKRTPPLKGAAVLLGCGLLALAPPPSGAQARAATAAATGAPDAKAADGKAVADRDGKIRLAREVEGFGATTASPDALMLAARMWHDLGAAPDKDRALDRAQRAAGGDARLLSDIRALRAARVKGVVFAPPVSIAPGERADTRSRVKSGAARALVTTSLPSRLRLVVTDGKGTELCAATGGDGGVECAWTAPWDGDVVLSVQNLGDERLSAWTIMRSADNNERQDEGTETWR